MGQKKILQNVCLIFTWRNPLLKVESQSIFFKKKIIVPIHRGDWKCLFTHEEGLHSVSTLAATQVLTPFVMYHFVWLWGSVSTNRIEPWTFLPPVACWVRIRGGLFYSFASASVMESFLPALYSFSLQSLIFLKCCVKGSCYLLWESHLNRVIDIEISDPDSGQI